MPQKTATEWERAADAVDRAEWRLLEALEAGDDDAVAAAEDALARCQRRTGRLRPKRTSETQGLTETVPPSPTRNEVG